MLRDAPVEINRFSRLQGGRFVAGLAGRILQNNLAFEALRSDHMSMTAQARPQGERL
jgi:hypothetical protein